MPPALKICLLPGDGIGPEVLDAAVQVLDAAGRRFGFSLDASTHLIGGAAVRSAGVPLPPASLEAARTSRAVLLGAVGSPEFDAEPPRRKPETGLLGLRQALGCWANLRPVRRIAGAGLTPLREEVVAGADILVLRELTGGLYFGQPRGFSPNRDEAFNTLRYSVAEIERLARFGFELARQRRRHLTSVDKANVLEVSQLWREVFRRVGQEYPDVTLDHMYVDNCSMQLILRPGFFDVVATENMFGDILSDEAGVLAGSLGLLPSASLGGAVGLYEPVHGSAPDIAGKGWANPIGAILSAGMMLRHSFQMEPAAVAIERAVEATLRAGEYTKDLVAAGAPFATTSGIARGVAARLGGN